MTSTVDRITDETSHMGDSVASGTHLLSVV